jgi:hypothetical protein
VHGGDLIASGFRNVETIDRIQELGWPGVQGNADEMLWRPDKVAEIVARVPDLREPLQQVLDSIPAIRETIGADRLRWLQDLPQAYRLEDVLVVHATPHDLWKSVTPECGDRELVEAFGAASASSVYLLLNDGRPEIRRVEYDVEQEARDLLASGYPGASWLAETLRAGRYLPYKPDQVAT